MCVCGKYFPNETESTEKNYLRCVKKIYFIDFLTTTTTTMISSLNSGNCLLFVNLAVIVGSSKNDSDLISEIFLFLIFVELLRLCLVMGRIFLSEFVMAIE